ncbi:MAG: PLP-dependent aminotransferase family protein [Clostridia bacterium]|nr:PLP-dependent aminotransferase family protein [Clostridia bacterium]
MEYNFSNKLANLKPSAIREILKATSDPRIIPLAAGNPSVEAFPVDDVRRISSEIFAEMPITALQYSVTEGYPALRESIAERMKKYGIGREFDQVLVTAGAQQVMDLATKSLCNEGDTVICEAPSFIGSLNCFRANGCRLVGVEVESDGMNIEKLEQALKTEKNVKFIYTIPNFQNPAGVTMSLEKRKALYEVAKKYGVLILEDNPYGDLRVSGEDVPSIKSFDEDGIVIYAGSFSKILSPGLRVGYSIAPQALSAKMTVCKQTEDVHTAIFNQLVVSKWMKECDFDAHIEKLRNIYREKLNLMCDTIDAKMNGFFTYNRPEGGLFVWCKIPDGIDMPEFCKKGIAAGVAAVPGSAFMVDDSQPTQYIRLNFSTPSNEQIVRGIELFADIAKTY